jgi:WD40 repeat protein
MSFSPDGRQVAVGQANGTVVTYELATRKEVRRLRGLAEPGVLAFHPDGSNLAIASLKSKEVAVYEVATGELVQKLSGHPSGVWNVAWHPRGYLLATASGDNAYLWDAATGQQHAVLQGHQASVVRVAFLPPGDLVLSTSWDGTTRLWEAATGRFLMSLPGGYCGFNREGSRLAVYTGGTKIGLWEVAPCREYRVLSSPAIAKREGIHDGSISPDGRWLGIGEGTGVRLWDLALGQDRAFLPTGTTYGVAFHPKDEALFTCGPAGLYRWPVHQEAETLRVGPPRQLPMSGAFQRVRLDAAGRLLAVASFAGGHVVNVEQPPGNIPLLEHTAANQVTVSPDARWIATGTHNGFGVKVWDAKNGQHPRFAPRRPDLLRTLQPGRPLVGHQHRRRGLFVGSRFLGTRPSGCLGGPPYGLHTGRTDAGPKHGPRCGGTGGPGDRAALRPVASAGYEKHRSRRRQSVVRPHRPVGTRPRHGCG